MADPFQRRGGILKASFILDLEADRLMVRIAFGVAQRMRAGVRAQIKILVAAFGDLQTEAGSREMLRRFQIGRTEANLADILELDHVVLLFLVLRAQFRYVLAFAAPVAE